MRGWWSDTQARCIAVGAKRHAGAMWSWFGRAGKEALAARETVQFLRTQCQGDLPSVGDVVDLFEAVYTAAGLRPNKVTKEREAELVGVPRTFRPED